MGYFVVYGVFCCIIKISFFFFPPGMYHYTIGGPQPYALSLKETLLSEHLSTLGYANHLVGKWHLGFFKQEYTPVFRGFNSTFGYWTGRIDYYDHTSDERVCCIFIFGFSTVLCPAYEIGAWKTGILLLFGWYKLTLAYSACHWNSHWDFIEHLNF